MAKQKSTTPAKGFTSAFLDNLNPKDQRIELADKACPGLRLCLEPSGRKSFVWYYNDAGKNRVLTLGRNGESESCLSLAQALGVIDNVRERYLDAEEIKAVWQAIDKAPRMSVQVRIGLKILLLTGARTGELLKANWEQIDFDKAEWFIPEENSETTAWTVPMVRALFHELKEIADDLESPWVMAGRTDGPVSDKVLGRAMRRLFELEDKEGEPLLAIPSCSPHDFRQTLRTHLEDLGIEPHIAEKCLNHSLGRIERKYNRNTLIEKRRDALQTWANFVDLLVPDRANVVRMGGAA